MAGTTPLAGAVDVVARESNTCAWLQDGTLQCWGYTPSPILLRPTPGRAAAPALGIANVAQATLGDWHACAITGAGNLYCWGSNTSGQTGRPPSVVPAPALVQGLPASVAAVAAGADHTCATVAGGAWCWGNNNAGQLGDGSFVTRFQPQPVAGLGTGVESLAGGAFSTCAVVSGAVHCWGSNGDGELGDGTNVSRPLPGLVPALATGVTALALGRTHACAIQDGTVKCWGNNASGQLGDGGTLPRNVPVAVTNLPAGSVAIAAGPSHSCALLGSGEVYCWGQNAYGAIGDGSHANIRTSATPVIGLESPAVAIAAARGTTCAVLATGRVQCFGYNDHGELGDDSRAVRPVPTEVGSVAGGIASLAAGTSHGCVVASLGAVNCWGKNAYGEVGDGTQYARPYPVLVSALPAATGISASADLSCAVTQAGGAYCWGRNGVGRLGQGSLTEFSTALPLPVQGLASGVAAVAAGGVHVCARMIAGTVKCWGAGSVGALGHGGTASSAVPVDVIGLGSDVADVAVGASHACVRRANGGVRCWGNNLVGQVGDGTRQHRLAPVDVASLGTGVTALALGGEHTCAVNSQGGLLCWGGNDQGQLGDGTTATRDLPTGVTSLANGVVAVTAGSEHSCALLATGAVKCWGGNTHSQLGPLGVGRGLSVTIPIDVPIGEPALAIAAGAEHTCARLAGGRAKCWGRSLGGRLGNGDAQATAVPRHVVVGDFATTVAVSSTPNPSNDGAPVTLSATVAAADDVPIGDVTFHDASAPLACGGVTPSAPLIGGTASCTVALAAGTYTMRAQYQGSSDHQPSTGFGAHQVLPLAAASCAGFADVAAVDPFCAHVDWMRNRGITQGCGVGQYCPQAAVSRLAMAAFQNRLGAAASPQVVMVENQGALSLDGQQLICTGTVPAANYPRVVELDGRFAAAAVAPEDVDIAIGLMREFRVQSIGASVRGSFGPGRFTNLRTTASYDLSPGETLDFGLLGRSVLSLPALFDARCVISARVFSRASSHAPHDGR